MIEILLKSSVAIGVAFLFYKLFLQQESFFATKRFYLLGCLVLAFALPFISIPKLVSQQGYLSEVIEQRFLKEKESKMAFSAPLPEEPISPVVSTPIPETETAPAFSEEIDEIVIPATVEALEAAAIPQENGVVEESWFPVLSLQTWLLLLYLFGVGVLFLSLLFQLGCVFFEIIRSRERIRDGEYIIVNTVSPKAPCSFFKYIFIYPDDYDFETYEQIIKHEKTHVRLGHSFDLLLAELAVIVLWFNPVIWLFKKEIEKNNEYQTDAILLEKEQVRKDQYQLNLLQIAVPNKPLNITTNYNQSLIKQRIIMMNSKRSTPHAYWKYTFLAPLFLGMLLLLNEPARSQEKKTVETEEADTLEKSGSERLRNNIEDCREIAEDRRTAIKTERKDISATRAEAIRSRGQVRENLHASRAENIHAREVIRENLRASRAENIRAREVVRENRAADRAERAGAIERGPRRDLREGRSFSYSTRDSKVDMTEGVWYSSIKNGKYCIEFRSNTEEARWMMSDCFEMSAFQKRQNGQFVMKREAGSLQLNGNLDAEVGQGKYVFTEDADFRKLLNEKKLSGENQNHMFHLFLADVSKEYVNFLTREYPDLDADDFRALAIHGVKMENFKNYVNLFTKHSNKKPSVDDIIAARIHRLDEAYVAELQKAGFSDLPMKKMMEAKIHGISASYVNELQNAGFSNLSIDEVVRAKIHGVNPSSVKEMRALGAEDLDKIIQLQIHNVDAGYVNDLQAAGLGDLSMDEIISAKIHGLHPSSIQEIRALGLKDLSFDDLLSARIHGVDEDFVKDLQKAGFSNLSMRKIVSAKIHGVNGGFIEEARKQGYDLNSIDKYVSLKIHGSALESLKEN